MPLLDAENTPWILVAFKISSRKINTYGFVSSQIFFSCTVSLDTLYKIPDYSDLPVRMTVILTPVTHSSECPGTGPRGAGQMLRAEICWCREGQWWRSGGPVHLDVEGSKTPQGGWRKEEGEGRQKSFPLHVTTTRLVRGRSLQRESPLAVDQADFLLSPFFAERWFPVSRDKSTLRITGLGFTFRKGKPASADQLHSFLTHCLSNLLPRALLWPEPFQ